MKDVLDDVQSELLHTYFKAHFLHTAIISGREGRGFKFEDIEGMALMVESIQQDIDTQRNRLLNIQSGGQI